MLCAHCGAETPASPCSACGAEPLLEGRYRLVGLLGQGAQGTTFRALGPEGEVAIKELPVGRTQDPGQRARLEREAAVLGQLRHPAIPRLHESFWSGQGRGRCLYLVQERVEGQDLESWIEGHRSSEAEVVALMGELCDILEWLHGRSPPVLHRDLKPANVLRSPDGRLHLVDFGSVREALRDPDFGGSTTAGTFGYMAPEQLVGDASPRSDLYSLGALAVRLLTRQAPASLLDRAGRMDWRRHAVVSGGMAALLDALLSPDPAARPASAADVKARLEAITRGEASAPVRTWGQPVDAPVPSAGVARAADLLQRSLSTDGELVATERGHRWVELGGRVSVELQAGSQGLVAMPEHNSTPVRMALLAAAAGLVGMGGLGWLALVSEALAATKVVALEAMGLLMVLALLATPVLSHLGRRRRVQAALLAAGAQVAPPIRERVSEPITQILAEQPSVALAQRLAGRIELELGLGGELRPLGEGWRWRSRDGGRRITALLRPGRHGGSELTVGESHAGLAGGLFGGFVGSLGGFIGLGVGIPMLLHSALLGGLWLGLVLPLSLLLPWLIFNRVRRRHRQELERALEGAAPLRQLKTDGE